MMSPCNYDNHWLLSMIFLLLSLVIEYDFFASIMGGYLPTKFEVFRISQS